MPKPSASMRPKRQWSGRCGNRLPNKQSSRAVKSGGDNADDLAAESVEESEAPADPPALYRQRPDARKAGRDFQREPEGRDARARDELKGFLRGPRQAGPRDGRAFYLECWAGDGRFTLDSIGRGTLEFRPVVCRIIGTVQPGPLQCTVSMAAGGAGDDGLLPRFQLLGVARRAGDWRNVDHWPDKAAKHALEVFDRLADLDPAAVGAEQDNDDGVPFLRFRSQCPGRVRSVAGRPGRTLRSGTLPPALEAVLAEASEPDSLAGAADSLGGWRQRPRAAICPRQGRGLGAIPVRPCPANLREHRGADVRRGSLLDRFDAGRGDHCDGPYERHHGFRGNSRSGRKRLTRWTAGAGEWEHVRRAAGRPAEPAFSGCPRIYTLHRNPLKPPKKTKVPV